MIELIPAIDIIDGKCVRLEQGDFDRKTEYDIDPLVMARRFQEHGIKRVHVVDLDGARQRRIVNWQVLQFISEQTKLKIDFGGGIQSNKDIRTAFECGADQVIAGSIAVRKPIVVRSWVEMFGAERIILGADVRDGKIAISGWQEQTDKDLFEFISGYYKFGLRTVICTDISRDGLLTGPAYELYGAIKERFPEMKVIASGGISSVEEIQKLDKMGIDGVIFGKALYEGKITLKELAELC